MDHINESNLMITGLLVGLRISAMLALTPMFGSPWFAWRMRLALASILTLLIMPMIDPVNRLELNLIESFAGEILCGLLLGLGIRLTIMGMAMAGDLISQLTGWSLGQEAAGQGVSAVPGGTSPLGKLFAWTMIATFIAAGGPNQVIRGLLDSFAKQSPGAVALEFADLQMITWLLQQSFELALRVAAPAVFALIVATLLIAIVQRSAPTVNSFQVGFALKSVLAIAVAAVVVTQGPNLIANYVQPTLERIQEKLGQDSVEERSIYNGVRSDV